MSRSASIEVKPHAWSGLARADQPQHLQQVNVTEGGQAVVAGDTVTRGQRERRRGRKIGVILHRMWIDGTPR
jgi:hypothetical protein